MEFKITLLNSFDLEQVKQVSIKEIIWDNLHHPSDPAQDKTTKCYINTADDKNHLSHSTHEKLKCSIVECYIIIADEENLF